MGTGWGGGGGSVHADPAARVTSSAAPLFIACQLFAFHLQGMSVTEEGGRRTVTELPIVSESLMTWWFFYAAFVLIKLRK